MGFQQQLGNPAAAPGGAIQQYRFTLIQPPGSLLDHRQRNIDRAWQCALPVLQRLTHIDQLRTLGYQSACVFTGEWGMLHGDKPAYCSSPDLLMQLLYTHL